jgi:hypothetical protein
MLNPIDAYLNGPNQFLWKGYGLDGKPTLYADLNPLRSDKK